MPGELNVWVETTQRLETFAFGQLILATGARERFLPFPGWTLPGVFGAGGLQALVRSGYNVRGKRVVVAWHWPSLAGRRPHTLKQDGAEIVSVHEQAPTRAWGTVWCRAANSPTRLEGIGFRAFSLPEFPIVPDLDSLGHGRVERVTGVRLSDRRNTWTTSCDLLAVRVHRRPTLSLRPCLVAEAPKARCRWTAINRPQLPTYTAQASQPASPVWTRPWCREKSQV